MQKTKICSKWNIAARAIVLIPGFWQFRQVFVQYLMSILITSKYTGGYIYQVSLWEIPLRGDLFRRRNRPEKCPFTVTNNWIVLALRWSVKYFFARKSPLFRKSGGEKKKKKGNYEAFCFSSKRNKIINQLFPLSCSFQWHNFYVLKCGKYLTTLN